MTISRIFPVKQLLLLTVASASLTACVGTEPIRPSSVPAPLSPNVAKNVQTDFDKSRPAIRRIRLTGDFFALRPQGGAIPASILNSKVRVDFPAGNPTFDDLVMLLEDRGLSVVVDWDDGMGSGKSSTTQTTTVASVQQSSAGASTNSGSTGSNSSGVNNGMNSGQTSSGGGGSSSQGEFLNQSGITGTTTSTFTTETDAATVPNLRDRRLPFRRYEGTLGGLFAMLQRSMGINMWWNDGIYVSQIGRYSVMLPQSRDLMSQVVVELQQMGATGVVGSMQAGTVSFIAPAAIAEANIRPYLLRLGRNASEVTLQVALVSVLMSEDDARGFDWSKFNLTFGQPSVADAATTPSPVAGGTTGSAAAAAAAAAGTTPDLFELSTTAARFALSSVSIFGVTRPLDITGAIEFLSTYGHTKVDQNVELRTLSGTSVSWRSGESIPYVSGVSATTNGGAGLNGGGTTGAAQTANVDTGLTIKLQPNVESSGGLVTVTFDLQLKELVKMVELSAGNQLGTLTQPQTREQRLNDIVRIPIGETVVLGGLRRSIDTDRRTGLYGHFAVGSQNKSNETQTMFVIMRPVVTFYDIQGLEIPLPQKSGEINVNANGGAWVAPEMPRGTDRYGAPTNVPPQNTRAMMQPGENQ